MAHLELEVDAAIAVVRFANPPLQVMMPQTMNELHAMLPRLAEDDIRGVVFTGTGDEHFIRHYSIEDLDNIASGRGGEAWDANMDDILLELGMLDKPVIAALNGSAAGGGFEFALACDIRVAKDGPFTFGLPEIAIGILPGAGGTQRLTQIVGRGRALELMLRPRLLTAAGAHALGIFEELVPADSDESALDRALVIAREIASRPAAAVRHIKALAYGAAPPVTKEALVRESELFAALMATSEAQAMMKLIAGEHRAAREGEADARPDRWMDKDWGGRT